MNDAIKEKWDRVQAEWASVDETEPELESQQMGLGYQKINFVGNARWTLFPMQPVPDTFSYTIDFQADEGVEGYIVPRQKPNDPQPLQRGTHQYAYQKEVGALYVVVNTNGTYAQLRIGQDRP